MLHFDELHENSSKMQNRKQLKKHKHYQNMQSHLFIYQLFMCHIFKLLIGLSKSR